MIAKLFKIDCITDLHVGSGDINYNIVDNEVEKDPNTNMPIIHASGIKGALRDHFSKPENKFQIDISRIFGRPGNDETDTTAPTGSYKFMDAHLLARPLRVSGSEKTASVPVTTVAAINRFLSLCGALGCSVSPLTEIPVPDFGGNAFVACCDESIKVEGENTGKLTSYDEEALKLLKSLLGDSFAIAASLDDFDLPVLARNCLQEGRENLWYEEVVPYGSSFYFIILIPDGEDFALNFEGTVQFGAHSSIGRGYCKVTAMN